MCLVKCVSLRLWLFLVVILAIPAVSEAADVKVYRQIATDLITARASSHIKNFPAENVVNGNGMKDGGHISENVGQGMWISELADKPVRYSEVTREGAVWFLCELSCRCKCLHERNLLTLQKNT